jgi:lipopolysaccharide export system protein LptA
MKSLEKKQKLIKYNFILFCAQIILISIPSAAYSEEADRDKSIEIESDTMTVDDAKNISIYKGDVILTQGTLIIRASKLTVREDSQGFQHSTAIGKPTTFKQKRDGIDEYIEGSADRIEYDGHMDKVHLYSKASVKRGNDTVFGDYIMYDTNAEFAQALSGNTKDENGNNVKKGRTRVIIKPKKEN